MTNDEDHTDSIVQRLLEVAPEERGPLLEELCGGDDELRRSVEALLAEFGAAEAFVEELGERLLREPIIASTSPPLVDPYGLAGSQVGRFRIEDCIGGGGMGLVYRATDSELRRTVALKFLPPEVSRDLAANERFRREAIAASKLDHAGIATIHEIGTHDDGRLFIAMAYYDGETLREKMASSPVDAGDAIRYAIETAQGLSHAHANGVIHRDIKPANIMITAAGEVKILDFGLAQMADVSKPRPEAPMGTIAYMSPEQARGDDVDARTDLWSLGVVLFEMLAGKRPFEGRFEQAVINLILNEEPTDIGAIRPDLPGGVLETVRDCLAKDREQRPVSADEVVNALAEHLDSARGVRYKARVQQAATSTHRRVRTRVTLGLALAAIIATAVFLWLSALSSTPFGSFDHAIWTKDANNPVMSSGEEGSWDRHVFKPRVLFNPDSLRFEMWFGASPDSYRPYSIGFAHSRDGRRWSRHPLPVLEADSGSWDARTTEDHSVIREHESYKMWYAGADAIGGMVGIGYATSTDGITWTKHAGNPILKVQAGDWEEGGINFSTVVPREDGGYQMWYHGDGGAFSTSMQYAVSTDGINWRNVRGVNPVFAPGSPGSWDDFFASAGSVLIGYSDSADQYHMWYTGRREELGFLRRIGYAFSNDGLHWVKRDDPNTGGLFLESDPITTSGSIWDQYVTQSPSVILIGDTLHMWYAGTPPTDHWQIGHATAPVAERLTANQDAYLAYRRGLRPIMWEQKTAYFEEACALDPAFVRAHLMRTVGHATLYLVYDGQKTFRSGAAEAAERVHSLSPGSVESSLASGYLSYFIDEDYESALHYFRAAARLRPTDSFALESLGLAQGQAGMYEEAIRTVERAFELNPWYSAIPRLIAWMHFGLGHYREAHAWMDRVMMINPYGSTAVYHKAVFMERTGDTDRAREMISSNDPGMPRFSGPGLEPWKDVVWIVSVHVRERDFDAIVKRVESTADFGTSLRNRLFLTYIYAVAIAHGTQDVVAAESAWRDLLDSSRNLGDFYGSLASMHAYAGLQMTDSLHLAVSQLRNRVGHRLWIPAKSGEASYPPFAQDYPSALFEAAVALTRGGLHDAALDLLEELSALRFRSSYPHRAVLDYVYFDSLRDDPRFQALLENWDRRG